MLSSRTLSSLAQLLAVLPSQDVIVLMDKHGLHISIEAGRELFAINNSLRNQAELPACFAVVEEVVRTNLSLSSPIKPRYRFSERFDDLKRCLILDGYLVEGSSLVALDPSIADTPPLDDDLHKALASSNLDGDGEIAHKLNDSVDSFRRSPPDLNACLTNARVALEATARAIARSRSEQAESEYDPAKWGSIIAFLRSSGFFSQEEERGLAGVYAFLSPGAHRPLGLTDEEASRLGRSLALSMTWYLVKRHSSGDA
jgi:hypothetical protein